MKFRSWLGSLFLGTALGVAATGSSPAPGAVTLDPPKVMVLLDAVTRAPALAAARAQAVAARLRVGAAGRFPDPEVEGMFSGVSTPAGDNPMWEINLLQRLPKAGERAADRHRAQAAVSLAEAQYGLMAGEFAAGVAIALAEAEAAQARVALLERQIQRSEQALDAVDARVATGSGRIGDRLALQTGIAAMRLMIEKESRMAADARSEARSQLGLGPEASLPDYAAPAPHDIHVETAPLVQVAAAKGAQARATARMARASARPSTAVGLHYEREDESMGSRDAVGLILRTEIPWHSRRYARAEEHAAQAEEDASQAEVEAVTHRLKAALSRVDRAERLAERASQLMAETRRRLDAEYGALVRAAGTGAEGAEPPVVTLLEILERQTAAETQIIDAQATARVARAELWRFAPIADFIPQPGNPQPRSPIP